MEPWYRLAVCIVKPAVVAAFRRDFRDRHKIPRAGGVIVAVNHISHADPFVAAVFLHDAGRRPRFMGKESVFRIPVLGRIVRGARQIPVYRDTADAAHALSAAADAVRAGECVVIYPEGTVTRDPDYWPLAAKSGVARLAMETGAPVVPVAQWGAQHVLGRDLRPRPFPRKRASVVAGDPVDLSRWQGGEPTTETLREATAAVMHELRRLVGELRGEAPPPQLRDARAARRADARKRPA